MALPVFPAQSLPGIAFPIKRTPTFRNIKQTSMSGRRTAFALQASPIYKYELTLSLLRPDAAYQELQTLVGFFNSLYGGQGMFAFYDPNDYSASAQSFGVADGVSTSYQLVRAYAGFVEPVFAPFQGAAPTVIPMLRNTAYAPNNVWQNSESPSTGAGLTGMTDATGVTDPGGGTTAITLTETTANSAHYARWYNEPIVAGVAMCFSVYLKNVAGEQYVNLNIDDGVAPVLHAVFDLTNGLVAETYEAGGSAGLVATITPVSGGWFRCAVAGIFDLTTTTVWASVTGTNGVVAQTVFPTYTGSTSNSLSLAWPQIEIQAAPGAPGPYNPTLTTRYYGGPQVFVAGVYQDPTAYTISSTGQIVFTSAPAASAALTWTGSFAWPCRFDDDGLALEQFMYNMFEVKSLKFSTELL